MKKIVKFASFAFVMGLAVAMTSCHRGDSYSVEQTAEIAVIQANTLQVKFTSNVSGATVTYAGKTATKSGNTYTVKNAPATGTVKVALPAAYVAVKDILVTFGDRKTVVVTVTPMKKSTNLVAQATVDGGTNVTNDAANATATTVNATFNLNGVTAGDKPGVTDPYSLTVYTVPQEPVEEVVENQPYPAAAYTVDCNPDGTDFTEGGTKDGAHMDLRIDGIGEIGLAGVAFQHEDGTQAKNQTIVGDILSADLPHFSNWNVVVLAKCVNITVNKIVLKTGNLNAGAQTVSFKENFGYSSSDATSGILKMWMQLIFGASFDNLNNSASLMMERAGMFTIYQEIIQTTFVAGNKTFHVTTYGGLSSEVVYNDEPVATHVGGSN